MSFAFDTRQAQVARLRIRGHAPDALLAKLRASSALSSVALAPVGLSPAAILVIRRLDDPFPGGVSIDRPGARVRADWEQAVRARMASIARRAIRPAAGVVSDMAEAVLFGDESEMLVCLARDWLDGAATRWWWRALFPGESIAGALLRAWDERPQAIPAALLTLSRAKEGVPFIARVDSEVVRRWLRSMVEVRRLSGVAAALIPFIRSGDSAVQRRLMPDASSVASTADEPSAAIIPPWRAQLTALEVSSLDPLRQALLGISLTLAQRPAEAATKQFAAQAMKWVAAMSVPARSARRKSLLHGVELSATSSQDRLPGAVKPAPTLEHSAAFEIPARPWADEVPATSDAGDQAHARSTRPVASEPDRGFSPATERAQEVEWQHGLALQDSGVRIETELGGLFFLVNLGLFTGLYSDFTGPERPGIELSIWDFVALLGQEFIGEGLRADRIWHTLADLAGRAPGEAPGANFRPGGGWRMPVEWLRAVQGGSICRVRVCRRRLQAFHRSGAAVLDVPLEGGNPRGQLARESASYLQSGVLDAVALERFKQSLPGEVAAMRTAKRRVSAKRWLAWTLPYLRCRLERALDAAGSTDIARTLLRRAARIYLSSTRVDVQFALADLPVEVRLSGLDRDPGWVPAAGRDIRFHFD